jgi:hypothetical protein
VVEDFMDEYAAGRTPNPCLRCNEKIKFARRPRPGARLGSTPSRPALRPAAHRPGRADRDASGVDHGKDQSYVLGVLDQDQLRPLALPARRLHQDRRAPRGRRARVLVADKPDSHDICFVADGDTPAWLREKLGGPRTPTRGSIVEEAGEVCRHPRRGRTGSPSASAAGCTRRPAPDGKRGFVLDIEPVSAPFTVGPARAAGRTPPHRDPARWCGAGALRGRPDVTVKLAVRGTAPSIPPRWSPSDGEPWTSSSRAGVRASHPARPPWSTTALGSWARRRSRAPSVHDRDDVVGVWLGGLDGTTWWEQDADEPVLAASLMKVPVAMAAQALDLERRVHVHPDFDSVVAGERFELDQAGDQDPDTWAEVGSTQTLRELRRRSIVFSGNLAANLVMEQDRCPRGDRGDAAGAPDDLRPAGDRRRHRERRVRARAGACCWGGLLADRRSRT